MKEFNDIGELRGDNQTNGKVAGMKTYSDRKQMDIAKFIKMLHLLLILSVAKMHLVNCIAS
ncbi:hypothetical protein GCM10027037_03390 [Mucilaginibacter koreensis]